MFICNLLGASYATLKELVNMNYTFIHYHYIYDHLHKFRLGDYLDTSRSTFGIVWFLVTTSSRDPPNVNPHYPTLVLQHNIMMLQTWVRILLVAQLISIVALFDSQSYHGLL